MRLTCEHDGTLTNRTAVGALVPHALLARTVSPYVPGPTTPYMERLVVGNDPTNAPETLST